MSMTYFSTSDNAWASLSAGLLPKWLLLTAVVSVANSVQAYLSLAGTREVYAGPTSKKALPIAKSSPVTPLSARTFGTWTVLSAMIRLQAAIAITDPIAYRLAFASYGLAAAHFWIEWLVYGSARFGRGLVSPLIVSAVTLAWMWNQWGFYVS